MKLTQRDFRNSLLKKHKENPKIYDLIASFQHWCSSQPSSIHWLAELSSSSLFPDLCACPAMVTFFPSLSFSFTPSTSSHPSSPLSLPSHTPFLFFCKLWSLFCFFGLSLKPSTCDVNLLLKLQKRKEGKGCISKKKPQNPRNRSFQAPAGCLINSQQRSMFVS